MFSCLHGTVSIPPMFGLSPPPPSLHVAVLAGEDPNPITFKEQDGMDCAATTVKLPDGEYVPWRDGLMGRAWGVVLYLGEESNEKDDGYLFRGNCLKALVYVFFRPDTLFHGIWNVRC